MHSHFPNNFNLTRDSRLKDIRPDIELEVVYCEKTVFIASSDTFEAEYIFLSQNYPWHKFYKGKEMLRESSYGVAFRSAGNSKVPLYYKFLLETGIVGRIQQELISRLSLRRKHSSAEYLTRFRDIEEGDPVGLAGAVLTFFIVWGVAVSLSLPVFAFDVRHIRHIRISIILRFAYVKFLKIFLVSS